MTELHCRHLQTDIDQYKKLITEKMVDKLALKQKMVDNWSIKTTLTIREFLRQLNAIILYLCQNFRMTREQLIEKNKALFWYTPEAEKQNISDALLVETLLNYGTLDDYRELISVLGGKQVAKVFFSAKGRQKDNYYPEIRHFFFISFGKICIKTFPIHLPRKLSQSL